MELLANKFAVIVTSMKKKPYDFLDQRKAEFDQDFDDFKRQISDLHVSRGNLCLHKVLFSQFPYSLPTDACWPGGIETVNICFVWLFNFTAKSSLPCLSED